MKYHFNIVAAFGLFAASLAILSTPAYSADTTEKPVPAALRPVLEELGGIYGFTEELAISATRPKALPTPTWVQPDQKELDKLRLVREAAGAKGDGIYDLAKAPKRIHWANYALYPIIGFPRDAVDGFFGVVSFVPLLNLPIVGLGYEVVPTQKLVRHHDDWHRWPGRANAKRHGWIDSEAWGFFPSLHCMTFKQTDSKKVAEMKMHNEKIMAGAIQEGKDIVVKNAGIAARQAEYLKATRALYDEGKYNEVISRLVGYQKIDPLGRESRALLAASIIAQLPRINERDWAEATLGELLGNTSKELLLPVKTELKALGEKLPNNEDIPFQLAGIDTRLRTYGEAMEEVDRLLALSPKNVTYLRLKAEIAFAAAEPDWAKTSLDQLKETVGVGAVATRHAEGRFFIMQGKYAEARAVYADLVNAEPDNARFHYLFGAAIANQGIQTESFDKGLAVSEFGKAAKLATTPEDEDLYKRAQDAASGLRDKKPEYQIIQPKKHKPGIAI